MTTFIDTALFVKALIPEVDSAEAIAIPDRIGEPFAYSHLHEVEIPNAIRLKRFRGELPKAQKAAASRLFRADLDAGRFERIRYDLAAVFVRAEQLPAKFSGIPGTRSLELWHVAAALEAGCQAFASYDSRQRKAAALCGLQIIPESVEGGEGSSVLTSKSLSLCG